MEAIRATATDQEAVTEPLEGNMPVDATTERKRDLFSQEACQRRGAACLSCADTGCIFAKMAQEGLNKPPDNNVAVDSAEEGPKDYKSDLQDPNKPFVAAAFKKAPDSVTPEKSSRTLQESTTPGTANGTGEAPTETAKAADQTSPTSSHQTQPANGESGYSAAAPSTEAATRATRPTNNTTERKQDTPPVQKAPNAAVPTKPPLESTQPKNLPLQEPAAKGSMQIAESAPAPTTASGRQVPETRKPTQLEKETLSADPKPPEPKNTSAGTSKLRNIVSRDESVPGIDTDSIPERQNAKQTDTPQPSKNDQPQTVREATVAAAITAPSVSEGDSVATKSEYEAKPSHSIDKVVDPTSLSDDTESATTDKSMRAEDAATSATEPSNHKDSDVGPEDFVIPPEVTSNGVRMSEDLPVQSEAHEKLTNFEPIVPKTESIVEVPMSAAEEIADETPLEVATTEEPDATDLLAVHEATEQLAALEDIYETPPIPIAQENAPVEVAAELDDTIAQFANPEPITVTPESGIATEEANELLLDEELPVTESPANPTTNEQEPLCPYTHIDDEIDVEEAADSLEVLHGPFTTYLESQSSDDTDEEAEEPTVDVLQSFDHREEQPASSNSNTRKVSELARKILGRNAFVLAT